MSSARWMWVSQLEAMNDTSGQVTLSRKLTQSVILTSMEKRENHTALLPPWVEAQAKCLTNLSQVSKEQGGVPTGATRDTKMSRMWPHGPEKQEAETEK